MAERSASRAALLALRRDRQVIEEGHHFLDEKRVALAQELLRRAHAYDVLRAGALEHAARAGAALADAVGRHGLEGLQVYPPLPLAQATVQWRDESFLGVGLVADAQLVVSDAATTAAGRTLEGERSAQAFRELAAHAVHLAAAAASLLRLMREYRRTERRVRALEKVVLPEARADERRFEAALEEVDQEEIMRSRRFAVSALG